MVRRGCFTRDSDGRVVQHINPPDCGTSRRDLRLGSIPADAEYCQHCLWAHNYGVLKRGEDSRRLWSVLGTSHG